MADKLQDISEYHERLITTVTSPFIEIAGSYPPPPDERIVNELFYGDNLDIMRQMIGDGTVDLCYIDPPFNSKRNYYQIYNNIGSDDPALALAFTDMWTWGEQAQSGFTEIIANDKGRFSPQTIELIKGLHKVLKEGSLLAYLVSMTLRIREIHRVLKPTGSFYLHCDPTSSHYLKLILDGVFCSRGGEFQNELAWCYKSGGASKNHFSRKHDVLFFYTKSSEYTFNYKKEKSYNRGMKPYHFKGVEEFQDEIGWYTMVGIKDYWNIDMVGRTSAERLGYPTQKPEALLERLISASSNEDDVVLDAYCGCGTSVAVAQRLKRRWIGIDITYQAIVVILKRLARQGSEVGTHFRLSGVPRDMEAAVALANRADDRVRKEFEKWAILTYTDDRAAVNQKKGADGGIDGTVYFITNTNENGTMVFQVKSGGVGSGDIGKLKGEMGEAKMATFITLREPTGPMRKAATAAGEYTHPMTGTVYPKIQIVTIQEILDRKRLELPLSFEVLKKGAVGTTGAEQIILPVVA